MVVRKQPLPVTRIQAQVLQSAYALAQGFGLSTLTMDQLRLVVQFCADPSNVDGFILELQRDGRLPEADSFGRVEIPNPPVAPRTGPSMRILPEKWVWRFVEHWRHGVRDMRTVHLDHDPGHPEIAKALECSVDLTKCLKRRNRSGSSRLPAARSGIPVAH